MKTNRVGTLLVFLCFLFPALACSLLSSIPASKPAGPSAAPPQADNPQGATLVPTALQAQTEGSAQATSTNQNAVSIPAATPPPSALSATLPTGLRITSLTSYKDSGGNFHVVGEVINGEDKPISSIELTITIKDASGKTLLKDSSGSIANSLTFSPMLSTLMPGKTSPFDYLLSSDAGVPDKFDVKITGQNSGDVQTAYLQIQNAQIKTGANDTVFLTGEIVNKGDKPVQIYNMAGSLLDKDKKVLAAAATNTYSSYLQPAGDSAQEDRTPFSISINNPGSPIDSYATYLEADQVDPLPGNSLVVNITNNYFDDSNEFHIVGSLTNDGTDTLHTFLVGGLYAKDGTALDADVTITPIDIQAGQSLPYDISSFGNVNSNADEAALVDNFTVQVDRSATVQSSHGSVVLKTLNDQLDKSADPTWQLNGQITNTSNEALANETVIIAVYDAKGELVATDWTVISPNGDSIAPGETSSFKLFVYLDPAADRSSLTYKTFAAGEPK